MLRRMIDAATRFLGWLFQKRRVRQDDAGQPVKANLGAGLAVAPGWINVDGSLNALLAPYPRWMHAVLYRVTGSRAYYTFLQYHSILACNRFVFHDLSWSVPFGDNTLDCIYSSHFLEHLSKRDGARLVGEIYRVLKPGGRVRISIPDLNYALSLYASGEKERMLQDYFFIDSQGSYYARHKYMYDFEGLRKLLAEKGFTEIEKCGFQQGQLPDIEILDNRPEDSLFVEAAKPKTVGSL
jgi:predicted SAM-dependent methyltransferase